jgi:hypothetical protein
MSYPLSSSNFWLICVDKNILNKQAVPTFCHVAKHLNHCWYKHKPTRVMGSLDPSIAHTMLLIYCHTFGLGLRVFIEESIAFAMSSIL